MHETFGESPMERLHWLLGQRGPFCRDGLVEVPLYAPLDCDLLGIADPAVSYAAPDACLRAGRG